MNNPHVRTETVIPGIDLEFLGKLDGLDVGEQAEDLSDSELSKILKTAFEEFADAVVEELDEVDTSGQVILPTIRWTKWSKGRFKDIEPEPEPSHYDLSFDEMARDGIGWKFHLNFDPDDEVIVGVIGVFLQTLKEKGAVTTFKIGDGGGVKDGAPGKEATVYVGHKDRADIVASAIETVLGPVLEPPEGDAVTDGIYFEDHVVGRFDVDSIDVDFGKFSSLSVPILKKDAGNLHIAQNVDHRRELIAGYREKSQKVLTERYSKFYTGS